MLLILRDNKIDNQHIIFGEQTENNIINDSYFYPLYYITEHITMTSIVMRFRIKSCNVVTHFNKLKINFNFEKNKQEMMPIINAEQIILEKFRTEKSNKLPVYKLNDIITSNFIKGYFENVTYSDTNCEVLVKISGIWENKSEFGLNYKFLS